MLQKCYNSKIILYYKNDFLGWERSKKIVWRTAILYAPIEKQYIECLNNILQLKNGRLNNLTT